VNKQIVKGAVVEHWIDRRLRLHQPTSLPGNTIRMTAETIVKLNEEKNRLQNTDYSLHERMELEASEAI